MHLPRLSTPTEGIASRARHAILEVPLSPSPARSDTDPRSTPSQRNDRRATISHHQRAFLAHDRREHAIAPYVTHLDHATQIAGALQISASDMKATLTVLRTGGLA